MVGEALVYVQPERVKTSAPSSGGFLLPDHQLEELFMNKLAIFILPILFLSGCKAIAMSDMDKAQLAYTECLKRNQNKDSSCKIEKLNYEHSIVRYQSAGGGLFGTVVRND
jgi:hypothetical protein